MHLIHRYPVKQSFYLRGYMTVYGSSETQGEREIAGQFGQLSSACISRTHFAKEGIQEGTVSAETIPKDHAGDWLTIPK